MLTYTVFGQHYLTEADALGVDGIRFDVPAGDLTAITRPFVNSGICPDFLLHDPDQTAELLDAIRSVDLADEQTSIEVFNEPPDFDHVDEAQYVEGILDVWEECARANYRGRVIAGAQKNLSTESMRWYARTVPALPPEITVAFHDYPYGLQSTDHAWPLPGNLTPTHEDAIAYLRTLTKSRPLVCSEFGRHMGHEIRGHPPIEERLTEQWIYWAYVRRLRLYASLDIVWTAIYQWQDDPNMALPEYARLYGLHAIDAQGHLTRVKKQGEAILDWHRTLNWMYP